MFNLIQRRLKVTISDTCRAAHLNDSVEASDNSEPQAALGAPTPYWLHCVRWVRWIVLMLALAGCTVGPDFVRPKAPVLDQWSQTDGAVLSQKPVERIRWWEAFDDPVLSALVKTAYENNYSLKVAGLRVLEARAQLGIAVGNFFPQSQQLSGSANSYSLSENAPNTFPVDLIYGEYSIGASANWELDFWGKFRRGIESADANLLGSIARMGDLFATSSPRSNRERSR